jgi:hypothetical protein
MDNPIVSERLIRVQKIVDALGKIPGVGDASLNDRTQTADSVDIFIYLEVESTFGSGTSARVKAFKADLRTIRRLIKAVVKQDPDMGINWISVPRKTYKKTQLNYRKYVDFEGYDGGKVVVDLWVR